MSNTPTPPARSVLISGASIAGPTLAYWLDRYGFEVTVVERSPAIRSGGYPIDIRGTSMEVIQRMGLRPAVNAAHIASRGLTFVDADGKTIGTVPIYDLTGNEAERDVELPRGELTTLLYGLTLNSRVRYHFEDSIETLRDDVAGVDVQFRGGERRRYDVVIGADGIHSNTRRLVFGPEAPFVRDLGATFNLFSLPNDLGLSHGAVVYAEPGRAAVVMAVRDSPVLFAMLTFVAETAPLAAPPDKAEQIERTAAVFADGGWEVPRLVAAMKRAGDLYFDSVSQIRMPAWSRGRVALIGDAAFAPSFRSGQGTSLALAGAYVLAGELAVHDDPADAFAAYERILRPYVEANQALAIKEDFDLLLPRTPEELDARNRMLAAFQSAPAGDVLYDKAQAAHSALALPIIRVSEMPNFRWRSVARVLVAAAFAYIGVYLVGPGHIVKSYTQWGYPPWAHFVAGAAFLSAAILLPVRQTRLLGAAVACCVLAPAATTCALHGDYAHAVQGPPLIALIVWLGLTPQEPQTADV